MAGGPSRGVWKQLDGLFRFGASGHLGDAELLGRYVAGRRDEAAEAAFAALVERHGPMVLGVCRRVLGDRHAAEDAFQATFLVLAQGRGDRPPRATGELAARRRQPDGARRPGPRRPPPGAGTESVRDGGHRNRAGRRPGPSRAAGGPRRGAGPAAGRLSRTGDPLRARWPVPPGRGAAARHPRGHALQPARPGQGPAATPVDPPRSGPRGRRDRGPGARGPGRHPAAVAGGFHHRGRGADRGRRLPGRGGLRVGRDPDSRSSQRHAAREDQGCRLRAGRGRRRHHRGRRARPATRPRPGAQDDRLGAVERKLDRILEALGSGRRDDRAHVDPFADPTHAPPPAPRRRGCPEIRAVPA